MMPASSCVICTQRLEIDRPLDLIPEYIDVVERMCAKFGTRIVRLHDVFREHLKYRDSDTFCPEPVHPNGAGHLVIAHALFDALSA